MASIIYFAKINPDPVAGVRTFSVSGIRSFQYSTPGFEASTVTILVLGAFRLVIINSLLPTLSIMVWSFSKFPATVMNLLSFFVRSLIYSSLPVVDIAAVTTRYFPSSVTPPLTYLLFISAPNTILSSLCGVPVL